MNPTTRTAANAENTENHINDTALKLDASTIDEISIIGCHFGEIDTPIYHDTSDDVVKITKLNNHYSYSDPPLRPNAINGPLHILNLDSDGVTDVGDSTPDSGGYLYVEAGALKYKGSAGNVTTLGGA